MKKLTKEMQQHIIAEIHDHKIFQAKSGRRVGEIAAIKWENVDIENRDLYICNQITYEPELNMENLSSQLHSTRDSGSTATKLASSITAVTRSASMQHQPHTTERT